MYLAASISSPDVFLYKSVDGINFTEIKNNNIVGVVISLVDFNSTFYLSTVTSRKGGNLYKSVDGINFSEVKNTGIIYGIIDAFLNFKNNLYVSTNLGQLFRS